MRRRLRLILLLIPTALIACDVDQTSAPTLPRQPSFAETACELGVTVDQARSGIAGLIANIDDFETEGTLTSGQANALRGHLQNVLRQLDAGKICPALAKLEAFRQQVANFEAEGILSEEDAEQLTLNATQIIVGPPNLVTIGAPSSAAGTYDAGWANYGPEPTVGGVTAPVALVNDGTGSSRLGCYPLFGFPAGAIALVERGVCPFALKTRHAQDAGAVAVIIYDNRIADLPTNMGGTAFGITIPTVSVLRSVGLAIIAGGSTTGTVSRKP